MLKSDHSLKYYCNSVLVLIWLCHKKNCAQKDEYVKIYITYGGKILEGAYWCCCTSFKTIYVKINAIIKNFGSPIKINQKGVPLAPYYSYIWGLYLFVYLLVCLFVSCARGRRMSANNGHSRVTNSPRYSIENCEMKQL